MTNYQVHFNEVFSALNESSLFTFLQLRRLLLLPGLILDPLPEPAALLLLEPEVVLLVVRPPLRLSLALRLRLLLVRYRGFAPEICPLIYT